MASELWYTEAELVGLPAREYRNQEDQTMTQNQNAPESRPRPAQNRRRKRGGVPAALVAALLVIALFFGGLLGFVAANKTNTYRAQLETAQLRITELENKLTMMGFSENAGDEWVFDDSGTSDEFGDLAGFTQSGNADVLWNDNALMEGMLDYTGESIVVAEFDGGQVTSDEVIEPYNDALAAQVFGFSDAADVSGDTLTSVIQSLVADKISYLKAEELGLTGLSDDDLADLTETARQYLDEQARFYAPSVDTSGMTDEEARSAVEAYLRDDMGITLDSLLEDLKADYWRDKLYHEVVKDVSVTGEEVQAAYDELLAQQQEQFTQYPDDYTFSVMSGQTIAYNLEGYRRVKHILLTFDSSDTADKVYELTEQIAALNPETDLDQISGLQTQLDALYTDLEARAASIEQELADGADFDALIEKYGQDDGMAYEPAKSQGYYISANSADQYSSDFVEGCMMLESVGQISTPVRSTSGVHIIKYIGDVPSGAVALDDIRDALVSEVLSEKQATYYSEQEAQWIASANPQYYPDRLQ